MAWRWPSSRRETAKTPMLEPERAYELWAPRYPAKAHNALMQVEQDTLLSLLPEVRGRAVLDAGCGTGRYAVLLADRGAAPVIGLDLSMAMLAHARAPARVRGSLLALPFSDASFDVIVSGLAMTDVRDLAAAVCECARTLRPGGTLVYSALHPNGSIAGWRRTFTADDGEHELRAWWHPLEDHERACAQAGLELDSLCEPTRLADGRGLGTAAVVVVRAEKAA